MARSELDKMDEWLNVLQVFCATRAWRSGALYSGCRVAQSVQLPFAILPVLKVTSSEAIMGPYR